MRSWNFKSSPNNEPNALQVAFDQTSHMPEMQNEQLSLQCLHGELCWKGSCLRYILFFVMYQHQRPEL